MMNVQELAINRCIRALRQGYEQAFGSLERQYADVLAYIHGVGAANATHAG